MYKVIGGDHKEYGPSTADELRQWIAEGRLSGQSLAQAEGSRDWLPLSALPEFEGALRAQADQVGATATPPAAADLPASRPDALTGQPELRIGRCLSRSASLFGANFGLLASACLLVWVLEMVCQFMPFIGGFVYIFLHGVLSGGLFLVFLRRIRGEPAAVTESLEGFGPQFMQLALAGFAVSLLSSIGFLLCVVPGLFLTVAWAFAIPLVADRRLEFWSAMELSRKVTSRVWFQVLALLVLAFLPFLAAYLFAQIKIFLTAYPMMAKVMASTPPDIGMLKELMAELVKVSVPLVLMNKVVLLFNLPFAAGALMYAYEDLFGTRPAREP